MELIYHQVPLDQKYFLIDSTAPLCVETNYLNPNMCKTDLLQNHESSVQSANSSKAYSKPRALNSGVCHWVIISWIRNVLIVLTTITFQTS